MKNIYNQLVDILNKHIPEYQFSLNYEVDNSFIYVWDHKELVYIINIDDIVKATKITNPIQLYKICLIILETKLGA